MPERRVAAAVQWGEEIDLEFRILRVEVAGPGAAIGMLDRQQAHLQGLQCGMRIDVQVGGQRDRQRLAGMGEIHVLGALTVAPAHAQHVAQRQERVRTDQHATGLEEAVVRQPLHHLEMARQHRRIAQRQRGLRKRLQRRTGTALRTPCDQRQHPLVFRPHIHLALAAGHVHELVVPIGAPLHLLAREGPRQVGHGAHHLRAMRGIQHLRVGGLGGGSQRLESRHGHLPRTSARRAYPDGYTQSIHDCV